MSGEPSIPATTHTKAHRFRAIIARSVLASPPEYASAVRGRPLTSCATRFSSRRTNASTSRDDAIGSRAERDFAREELLERFREVRLLHPDLFLRISLADRDAFSLECLVVDRDGERRANFVPASVPSADRSGLVV